MYNLERVYLFKKQHRREHMYRFVHRNSEVYFAFTRKPQRYRTFRLYRRTLLSVNNVKSSREQRLLLRPNSGETDEKIYIYLYVRSQRDTLRKLTMSATRTNRG